jgi:hypothetical protein
MTDKPISHSESRDPREFARSAVTILDGTIRWTIAEAGHMARWIYGSLFSLNVAGAAACVALEIGEFYKAWTAGFMLLGTFFILLGGVSTAKQLSLVGEEMARTMRYWLTVAERNQRDVEIEQALEQELGKVVGSQRMDARFMWLSFVSFVLGMTGVAAGIVVR